MLTPTQKAQWLAALRSSTFEQGQGRLRNTGGPTPTYCCLGVLCQLLGPQGWDQEVDDCEGGIAKLPHALADAYENEVLRYDLLEDGILQEELVGMNDGITAKLSDGTHFTYNIHPFEIIARHIEAALSTQADE